MQYLLDAISYLRTNNRLPSEQSDEDIVELVIVGHEDILGDFQIYSPIMTFIEYVEQVIAESLQ